MRLLELFDGWSDTPYYHGTEVDFDGEPRPSPTGVYGRGVYMSNRASYARAFGRFVHEYRIRGPLATNRDLTNALKAAQEEGFTAAAKYRRASDMIEEAGYTGIEDGSVTVVFSPKNIRPVSKTLHEDAELDMSEDARMDRAEALGFTIPVFHGTNAKFDEFSLEKGKPSIMGGFAPHFSDKRKEADGYRKEAGRGAKVLHCLLRIKKPLVISFDPQKGKLSPAEYKRITGHAWDGGDDRFPPNGRKALDKLMDDFGWEDHRANWTNAYQVLRSKGYDGLFYPDVAADHSEGQYGKYVVFDPKNVRLVDAAFDPSKSGSADLRA